MQILELKEMVAIDEVKNPKNNIKIFIKNFLKIFSWKKTDKKIISFLINNF